MTDAIAKMIEEVVREHTMPQFRDHLTFSVSAVHREGSPTETMVVATIPPGACDTQAIADVLPVTRTNQLCQQALIEGEAFGQSFLLHIKAIEPAATP